MRIQGRLRPPPQWHLLLPLRLQHTHVDVLMRRQRVQHCQPSCHKLRPPSHCRARFGCSFRRCLNCRSGETTSIRLIVVREILRHHVGSIEGPPEASTYITALSYLGVQGAHNWGSIMSRRQSLR